MSKGKTIVVKWVKEEEFGYGKAMKVIESDHERFSNGTRFDFGFFRVATDEGFTIISLPMNKEKEKCWCFDGDVFKKSCDIHGVGGFGVIHAVAYFCPECGRDLRGDQ